MPHNQRKQQKQAPSIKKSGADLGLLRFKADGSQVTLQHQLSPGSDGTSRPTTVPTIRIDLRASKVWVGSAAPLPEDSPLTLGIIGLLRLERGAILALVSKAKRVCGLLDGPVYKVEDTTLVAPEAINGCDNDLRYASLLQEALNPKNFGCHMYFSHTANLTTSRQRQADAESGMPSLSGRWHSPPAAEGDGGDGCGAAVRSAGLGSWWRDGGGGSQEAETAGDDGDDGDGAGARGEATARRPAAGARGEPAGSRSLWSRADPRFVWNAQLMRPLLDAGGEAFALPIMVGYVGQATGAKFALRPPTRSGTVEGGQEGGDGGSRSSGEVQCPGELTLITRVAVGRPVAGSWRRGVDRHGHTAGFAETEVILSIWQPEEQPPPAQEQEGQQKQQQQQQEGQWPPGVGDDGVLRRRTRVAVASYVTVRGSAPLYWAAPPDLRPCPAPRGPEEADKHSGAFRQHLEALLRAYGGPVLLLNLIYGANQRPQLRLHDALQRQVEAFTAGGSSDAGAPAPQAAAAGGARRAVAVVGLPLRRTDLGDLAACGDAAARLEQACAPETGAIRAFVCVDELEISQQLVAATSSSQGAAGGGGSRGRRVACVGRHILCRQQGVVRVSSASTASAGGCCNEVELAQHALALPVLAEALAAVGAMDDPADMERVHTNVVHGLAEMWSRQANVLADQALGTGCAAGRALKAAATRFEHRGGLLGWLAERTVRGPWQRAVGAGEALSRYYYSNFTDARRQDALDLASGAFEVGQPPAFMPRRQPPSTSSIQLGIILILAAIGQVVLSAFRPPSSAQELRMYITSPAVMVLIGVALLLNVLRQGATFVEQPLLRTDQVFPWSQ